MSKYVSRRIEKGKSLISFPSDYVVIDLETTGFSPIADEIIEFGAIRVRNGEIVDSFQSLCKPQNRVDEYITMITGISNDMLVNAPYVSEVIDSFLSFIGDDIIVGHNVNFDINFVYDVALKHLGKPLSNNFIDTMRIARRLLPDLPHHRLSDIVEHYKIIQDEAHRAVADCISTFKCFEKMSSDIKSVYATPKNFLRKTTCSVACPKKTVKLKDISTENTEIDCSHPLYGRYCVFTGELKNFTRSKAVQIVVDFGGFCQSSVTKKTNYLILGNYENCKLLKESKSSKHKKAEQLKLAGQDIEIIPESVFYDMLEV